MTVVGDFFVFLRLKTGQRARCPYFWCERNQFIKIKQQL